MRSDEVLSRLVEHGCEGRVTSIHHLRDLREEINGRYRKGQFNEEFYRERLANFDFRVPDSLPEARSIITVAVPRPQSLAVFTFNGESLALIIPPTYVAYEETREKVEDFLKSILDTERYRVVRTALPLKLLAVQSGLGSYGRNNLCYVPGMGSFCQLAAVYSDLPCEQDSWREVRMMDRCRNCYTCRKSCPTGAIPSDGFLLRADRCLVFHNEKRGDIPFPSWINPSWHNCLVGCIHCQRVCPQNRDFLNWSEDREDFSQDETTLILKGVPCDRLPVMTVEKLKRLSLFEDLDILPRNLSVFIRKN